MVGIGCPCRSVSGGQIACENTSPASVFTHRAAKLFLEVQKATPAAFVPSHGSEAPAEGSQLRSRSSVQFMELVLWMLCCGGLDVVVSCSIVVDGVTGTLQASEL